MEPGVTHSKTMKTLKREKKVHVFNLMTLRKWHWMSSAICFACMLLFAVTGITLNHAADIEAKPDVKKVAGQLPEAMLKTIEVGENQKTVELPLALQRWLKTEKAISLRTAPAEVNDSEIYLPQARPGGDAWLSINLETGDFEYENTSRGWISYFNDLHKGRNTGQAWIWFMDLFAVACVVFSITGFVLLQRYADTRAKTWPLVIAGFVLPFLLMVFLIH
jgi:uncharacterized protein